VSFKEWEKLIEEFKASGKSQAQWCREKNLKVKAFNYQYRKLRKIAQNNQVDKQINWLPVELKPLISSKLSIRVGKAVIEIQNGYDEGLLQSVVKSLEAIC
jgi:hypothetical protein